MGEAPGVLSGSTTVAVAKEEGGGRWNRSRRRRRSGTRRKRRHRRLLDWDLAMGKLAIVVASVEAVDDGGSARGTQWIYSGSGY